MSSFGPHILHSFILACFLCLATRIWQHPLLSIALFSFSLYSPSTLLSSCSHLFSSVFSLLTFLSSFLITLTQSRIFARKLAVFFSVVSCTFFPCCVELLNSLVRSVPFITLPYHIFRKHKLFLFCLFCLDYHHKNQLLGWLIV